MSEKVLVTGCNGFVALHVLDVLLSENFHVVGTVRSESKGARVKESFASLYPKGKLDIEVVEDITKAGSFDAVFQKYPDLQHVVHMAANFSFGSDKSTEETYLIPATKGTTNILQAILASGKNVKTFVQTSSFASIMNMEKAGDSSFVHTEATWNPITWDKAKDNQYSSYIASKKLAEVAAWDFVKENKKDVKFTVTTVCPPFILGPQMFDWALESDSLNTSAEIVNNALKSTPDFKGPFDEPSGLSCDVRDVASLHMLPLRNKELAGQRLFPVNGVGKDSENQDGKFNLQRILNVLNAKIPELQGKISAGNIKDNKPYMDKLLNYNCELTAKLSGVQFKTFEQTICDGAKQILDFRAAHN
ncbi:LANO_0E11782g1_1 [Lachancea nothofagi CBS 11611]|uniref:LANO_0E11782g1_1 n=1 Tax=Lachancea nothofagi CBS 11611 TaxID=1266666 RepID=A0A1G4JXY9_9SACH|nr:LANO_0E11782g1_1 [Lachancea nothofagi CBS 11611]